MQKYIKINNYIIETFKVDSHTYSIALWHVGEKELTCELCEILYSRNQSRAFFLWNQLVQSVRQLGEKKDFSTFEELPFTSTDGKDSKENKSIFRCAEESQK